MSIAAVFIRGERGHNRTVGMHKKFWVIAWHGRKGTQEQHDELGASKVDDLTKVQLSLTNCPARGNWKKKENYFTLLLDSLQWSKIHI